MIHKTALQVEQWEHLTGPQGPPTASMLVPVAVYVDHCSRIVAGKEAIVTGIFRDTGLQLDLIAKRNAQRIAQGLPQLPTLTRSVHEFWRGIDFRSWIYSASEIVKIVDMVNEAFTYGGRYKVLAFHKRGSSAHLHGQVPRGTSWEVQS